MPTKPKPKPTGRPDFPNPERPPKPAPRPLPGMPPGSGKGGRNVVNKPMRKPPRKPDQRDVMDQMAPDTSGEGDFMRQIMEMIGTGGSPRLPLMTNPDGSPITFDGGNPSTVNFKPMPKPPAMGWGGSNGWQPMPKPNWGPGMISGDVSGDIGMLPISPVNDGVTRPSRADNWQAQQLGNPWGGRKPLPGWKPSGKPSHLKPTPWEPDMLEGADPNWRPPWWNGLGDGVPPTTKPYPLPPSGNPGSPGGGPNYPMMPNQGGAMGSDPFSSLPFDPRIIQYLTQLFGLPGR